MIKGGRHNDSEIDLTPWSDHNTLNKTHFIRNLRKQRINFQQREHSSPYRPRTIQSIYPKTKKSDILIQNVIFNAPLKTNAFPKRSINSPARIIKSSISRSRSCATDKLSLNDIENIERKQRLIPYRLSVVYNLKGNSRNNSISYGINDSLINVGIVKESNFIHTNYKKYSKQA